MSSDPPRINCPQCHDFPVECDGCDGDGFVYCTCMSCEGTGWELDDDAEMTDVQCSECGGNGELEEDCMECGGDGVGICDTCDGEGWVEE